MVLVTRACGKGASVCWERQMTFDRAPGKLKIGKATESPKIRGVFTSGKRCLGGVKGMEGYHTHGV